MKKILWIALVLLLLIAGVGVYLLNMAPTSTIGNQSIDINMNAAALYKGYSADEMAGNKKYIGKILLTEGAITEISTDDMGATVLLLEAGNAPGGVLCTFGKDEDLSKLKVGDIVKVKGQCTGMLMDVVLNKCVLEK